MRERPLPILATDQFGHVGLGNERQVQRIWISMAPIRRRTWRRPFRNSAICSLTGPQ